MGTIRTETCVVPGHVERRMMPLRTSVRFVLLLYAPCIVFCFVFSLRTVPAVFSVGRGRGVEEREVRCQPFFFSGKF